VRRLPAVAKYAEEASGDCGRHEPVSSAGSGAVPRPHPSEWDDPPCSREEDSPGWRHRNARLERGVSARRC